MQQTGIMIKTSLKQQVCQVIYEKKKTLKDKDIKSVHVAILFYFFNNY